jgi:hypothetical protein
LDFSERKAYIFERLKQLIPSSQIFTIRQKRILEDFMNLAELAEKAISALELYDETRYITEALIRYYEVLPESEAEMKILEFWSKNKIYEKALKKREKGKKFYMCDGPPFATGGIHLGTALNKSLKDAVIRYKLLQGFYIPVRAGYDTHGLPIETQVEKVGGREVRDLRQYKHS